MASSLLLVLSVLVSLALSHPLVSSVGQDPEVNYGPVSVTNVGQDPEVNYGPVSVTCAALT